MIEPSEGERRFIHVGGDPEIHIDCVSDITKGVHSITGDRQKPCVMRIEFDLRSHGRK
jgi:hypothetical protein